MNKPELASLGPSYIHQSFVDMARARFTFDEAISAGREIVSELVFRELIENETAEFPELIDGSFISISKQLP